MNSKNVWDTREVYSLIDIFRNPKIPEAMVGRVFFILGIRTKSLTTIKRSGRPAVSFKDPMSEPNPEPLLRTYSRRPPAPMHLLILRVLLLVSLR